MCPRITMITLGVADLDRSVAFYRDGLGFHTQGIVGTEFENGAVAFFEPRPRPDAFKATGAAAERFDARIGMLPCRASA